MGLRKWIRLLPVLGALLGASHAFAQSSPDDLKHLTLDQLMNIEVTSVSKQPEPFMKAPAAIQVITQEDIRRSGASSLPEALRLADNLEVAQKNSSAWAISARGFNTDLSNKLLVLIDGRTVYTPLFSGVFWDRQDYLLEDIDHIEVISGPGGTLWGANAVNGVINIVTKSAKDSQGLYAEAGGGSQLRAVTGIRYGGSLGRSADYRVYGRFFDRSHEVLPNGNAAMDSWRSGQGGFRIDAGAKREDRFTLQGDFYETPQNLPTGRSAGAAGGNLLGRWSHAASDESDMKLQIYYDRTHFRDPVPQQMAGALVLAPAGTLTDDLDTVDLDFQHRFRLNGRNGIVWGLGYRFTHDTVQNAPGLAFEPPQLDQNLFNVFVQDEVRLAENVAFTLGTKVEHNDYTGFEIEPNVRLQWDMTPKQSMWSAVSRAVRSPSRVDRDERLMTPSVAPLITDLLIGGTNFKSETAIAYEMGYRAQLGSKVSASISGFYNDYNNIRSTSPSAPNPVTHLPFPYVFSNNLEGETHGFELAANYQILRWWRLHGGYDLLLENIHVKPGTVDLNNALNETADPRHQLAMRSSMDLPRNFELNAQSRWIDSFRFNNAGTPGIVPSYSELDSRLAWHATRKVELSVAGQNLLHNRHLEYVVSSPSPVEEIRRSAYGKLAIVW
ncbi:MAG TPA: TonB-dependent receptor [Terriglobia bacterium]|jgi:iron complex outermembrane receptor protein